MGYATIEGQKWELAYADRRYPEELRRLEDPPKRIYGIGNLDALEIPSVAIIGARKATPYGVACARMAAQCAKEQGIGVISGAAVGCDQAAQREALALGAQVSAVLGSGADVVYPSDAKDLLQGIIGAGGAVVSIQPWGSQPNRWSFVRRNAVIAALTRLVVICEAGLPSGTTTTARFAHGLDRAVAAFPGSVFSPNSRGANDLIFRTEALPVCDRESLGYIYSSVFGTLRFEEMVQTRSDVRVGGLTGEVLDALRSSASTPGDLAQALGMDVVELVRCLGELEAKGVVCRLSDGRYAPTADEFLRHNM